MVKINNPLAPTYQYALNCSAGQRQKLTSELVSGRKQSISATVHLLGTHLRSAAKTATSGINRINHGFTFINTTSSILSGIRDQLEELQNQIVSLGSADKNTMQSAQIMYESTMQRIAHSLKDSQFNGKGLFDGSFADSSKAHVSHCIPDNAAPLCIKYGPNPGEEIKIAIARLLPGDGKRNNPSVKDSFMPLFSLTENTYKALDALNRIPNVTNGDIRIVGGTQEDLSDAQRRLITEALPEGVSAEQDMIRARALGAFDKMIEKSREVMGVINKTVATSAKLVATVTARMVIFYNSHQELVEQTANSIINTINTAIPNVTNEPAAQDIAANIPSDLHNTNIIQRVMQHFVVEITNRNASRVEPNLNQGQKRLKNASESLGRLVARGQWQKFSATLYIGSFTNPHELEKTNKLISNAINNINEVLMSLKMQKGSLEQAKTQLQTTIIESSAAADNYLNANYDELIPKLLELNRQDKVIGLAFSISEKALNALLEQLEKAALS